MNLDFRIFKHFFACQSNAWRGLSRPARTRGLKRIETAGACSPQSGRGVASRADAWIETSHPSRGGGWCTASRADAWIETEVYRKITGVKSSRPARTRGLKHRTEVQDQRRRRVASRADAWIETGAWIMIVLSCLSRPARTRGLKLRAPDGWDT